MPIQLRHHKNPKRGTKVGFVKIPIEEINSKSFDQEFYDLIGRFYDQEGINTNTGFKPSFWRRTPKSHEEYSRSYGNPVKAIKRFVQSDESERVIALPGKVLNNGQQEACYFSLKKLKGSVLIIPQPFIHTLLRPHKYQKGITEGYFSTDYFSTLQIILQKGFSARSNNWNVNVKRNKQHYANVDLARTMAKEPEIVSGDAYSLELFRDKGHPTWSLRDYSVQEADVKRISAVNIELSPSASEEEKEEKMDFYKTEITGKYNVPVRFITATGDEKAPFKRILPKRLQLEQRITSIIAIAGLGAGLLFLSSNLTGNVIGNSSTSNYLGIGLLLIGLILGYFYIKKKNSTKMPKR